LPPDPPAEGMDWTVHTGQRHQGALLPLLVLLHRPLLLRLPRLLLRHLLRFRSACSVWNSVMTGFYSVPLQMQSSM